MEPEGFLRVRGLRIYYRSEGEPKKGTVFCLHGGPGLPYDYLAPFFDLTKHGYRVVIYDQGGSGKSEAIRNPARYTIESYVEEAEGVRKALGLGKVHLLGFSWGGMLAQAYALEYQSNLSSLILSGTTPSIPLLEKEVLRLFQALPADVRQKIAKYEEAGDFQNPEYAKAVEEFQKRHQLRLPTVPDAMKYSDEHASREVGRTLFGPNLVEVTGNMRYWDVTDRLGKLRIPCLIIAGEHDFLTPKLHKIMHQKIKRSKLVILEGAGHLTMWDRRSAYIKAVADFLDSVH